MSLDTSKQKFIAYLTNTKTKREEHGCLAQAETILFLKEKELPDAHAYAVRYTSTTGQQWDEAHCFLHAPHEGAGIRSTSFGIREKTADRFVATEEECTLHGSKPWVKLSGGERDGYWLVYGHVITNGYDVAHVRMIPASGQMEEEEIHDGLVFFLSRCSPPMTFELYDLAHIAVEKQAWPRLFYNEE